MPIKSVKMKISKNKKMRFFLMSQGSFSPKIRFLCQKVCSVARVHTDTQTDRQTDTQTDRHESEYRGHPFRVSGIFPSTYHQGSVQCRQERLTIAGVGSNPILVACFSCFLCVFFYFFFFFLLRKLTFKRSRQNNPLKRQN